MNTALLHQQRNISKLAFSRLPFLAGEVRDDVGRRLGGW